MKDVVFKMGSGVLKDHRLKVNKKWSYESRSVGYFKVVTLIALSILSDLSNYAHRFCDNKIYCLGATPLNCVKEKLVKTVFYTKVFG